MGVMKEFRDFAMRGNVVDLAVGVIIGAAFGRVVSTLVDKVLMPPLGYAMGGIDFADKKVILAKAIPEAIGEGGAIVTAARPEVAIYWGELVNVLINFIFVAIALFILIKAMNKARKAMEHRQEAAPPADAPAPADIVLLTEIRDLLRKQA